MDLAPYAGAIQVGGYVFLAGLFLSAVYWIYRAGGRRAKLKRLKEDVEGHNEFHERGEDWDAAGGLGGAVKRVPKSKD